MSFDFNLLRSQLGSASPVSVQPTEIQAVSTSSWINGIPNAAEVTVATFNHYDNGQDHKGKWSSSRFTMNVQLFTHTQPFTPSPALAAWKGTVQMHEPGFWLNYVDHKHGDGKIDAATYNYLKEQHRKTAHEYHEGALMGTFTDKNSGTNYSWQYFLRFWYDKFGEPNLEVHLDAILPTLDVWEAVKTVPGKYLPILRSRYNPHGLWKPKSFGSKGGKH
ncbi:hypothetical protein AAII07_56120 [Microvirga sp. 0TCS3.31]